MKIWAFVSQKGGSGKSTLATQLGVYASQCGEKTIIVDLDPQGSAKTWHAIRGDGQAPAVVKTPHNKVDAVMKAISQTGAFDLVLIDTPPHSDKIVDKAVRLADLIVCPTRPANFDIESLRDTARLIDLSDALRRSLVVVNCAPTAKGAAKAHKLVSDRICRLGMPVAQTIISDRRAYVTATDKGKGVTEMSDARATDEIQKLWGEINKVWPSAIKAKEKANGQK